MKIKKSDVNRYRMHLKVAASVKTLTPVTKGHGDKMV